MQPNYANQGNFFRAVCSHVAFFMLGFCFSGSDSYADAPSAKVAAGRYIITRKPISSSTAQSGSDNYSTVVSNGYFEVVIPKSGAQSIQSGSIQIQPLDAETVAYDCAQITGDPSIESCEPDVLLESAAVPNDPLFSYQWGLHDPANDADIDVLDAWERGTGSKSILIGVIDSGIYTPHPDLAPNIWINPRDPVDGVDNDGNGYIDDAHGANVFFRNGDPSDCQGHGTHVAGIIGAKGNDNTGITGVNWTTSIISTNIHHDCSPFSLTSSAVAAYNYFYDLKVRGHDIRVINASFGGYGYSEASYQAIKRLNEVGVLLVAAAGNDSKDSATEPFFPASYNLPNIISVAATGTNLGLANYSNFGTKVHIAAPGGDLTNGPGSILSTLPPLTQDTPGYGYSSGTSMAAPLVTGALGLIASQFPNLSMNELKGILFESAYSLSSLEGVVTQARFLNVRGMSDLAESLSDSCPNDPFKNSPGVCGCGISDTDSDGDGLPDCQDQCPADKTKTSPGICGCGISDSDGNGNGVIDCKDTAIGSVIPPQARIFVRKRFVVISMTDRQGMDYYLQITTIRPRGSRRRTTTGYYRISSSLVAFRKPPRGSRIHIRYAYVTPGTQNEFSYWSYFQKMRIRR